MFRSEVLVLLVSAITAGAMWVPWFRNLQTITPLASGPNLRVPLGVAPFGCLLVLFVILKLWSSFDVRNATGYVVFYMLMGAAWLGVATRLLPWFAISARDDVLERGNPAALCTVLGALVGITLCFAGGNIGDGPGWWVVVFCGLLSTGALFALLWVVDLLVGVSDAVTVDRDPASGIRLGAFLAAEGLVLGRAVAGDWHSAGETIADFVHHGWPAAALALLTVCFQRALAPTAERPQRGAATAGFPPALLLLATAAGWVAHLGRFE